MSSISGIKQLQRKLTKISNTIEPKVTKYNKRLAESIIEESKELCPKDTGTLVKSTFINVTDNGDIEAGYGKDGVINPSSHIPAKDYMITVHEDLNQPHKNGQAKFLEIAFYNQIDSLDGWGQEVLTDICK